MILSVKVKWNKENYSDIELNTDEDPLVFKAQLFALTGVQPERQKIMLKGTTLKDSDWGNIKLKDVCQNSITVHLIRHFVSSSPNTLQERNLPLCNKLREILPVITLLVCMEEIICYT
jgi:hypothetical protein